MEFEKARYTIDALVKHFDAGLLIPNPEYQRGATWDVYQRRGLIDSIFRRYPIPPLFLHQKQIKGLSGSMSEKHEIVDGQQRLIAISDFSKGKFPLFKLDDPRFKVPKSLRSIQVPWAGKNYGDLSVEQQDFFKNFEVDVQLITKVDTSDEIRDLFIRLQAGTALTPQQVRDAWPGNVGPFIERLAGKLRQVPSVKLFELIDRRGQRSEDDDQKDPFVDHRSTCSQLLRTFMMRASDPMNFVSVLSKNLDGLYHENPDFDPAGPLATAFVKAMHDAEDILQIATDACDNTSGKKKRKFRKVEVICVIAFLQDLQSNPLSRLDNSAKRAIGEFLAAYHGLAASKTTSGAVLAEHYAAFQKSLPANLVLKVDAKRDFDAEQKHQIKLRDNGKCQVCLKPVVDEDAEYDHYPVAHARGGRTDVSNGRLVHKRCHPRFGRLPD
jgi:Protein of unknown function DUF262/HNH endonuclease